MIRGSHLIVIDDDPIMLEMVGRTLDRLGYRVTPCQTGEEGLRVLEENRAENSLVVLDYSMPGMNGVEVCRAIRSNPDPGIAQTPVILLTAFSGEQHEVEALEAGADDFVSKPVNMTVLRVRIETHLRVALLRRQLQLQNRQLEEWRVLHERDMEAARLVQQAILPRRLPDCEGWQCAAHYQSLIQVGGDIYDGIPLSGGRLLLWCADATGHGAAAALLTTFTKLLFRYATDAGGPAAIIRHINRDFRAIFKGNSFLTAACLILEPESGTLHVAGAGHPPLLILRHSGEIEVVESTAPPVGLQLKKREPKTVPVVLEPGESALLISDGLYSVVTPDGGRMSFPELLERLRGVHGGSAASILREVLRRAHPPEGGEYDDDLTVMVIRRD